MRLPYLLCAALLALGGAVASAGCTSSDSGEGGPNRPASFVGETPGEGATVFLRGRPAGTQPAGGPVVVDVVARGAADLHGAAFRVTWDTNALAFVEAQSGSVWSKQALALSKEGTPGQLAVTWTEKGERGIDATGEVVLGTLVFDARGRGETPLTFKTERSQVVDKKGAPLVVSWRGGVVAGR